MGSGISSKPEQAGHGTPFVSFSTIFNNPILPEKLPDLMETTEKQQKECSVKYGDVFLTRTSETIDELAMSSVALKDYPQATFSGFAKRLRPKRDDITYPKFMAFYFRSPYFRKIVDANAIMTLRASFNEEIFSYINLYLPDYETQKKIGDFFWEIEEKIRNNKKQITVLESLAKTLYDYWFLQFDFPDENGKPYKSSGGKMVWNDMLGWEIPEGWGVRPISDAITHMNTGLNPRDNFKLGNGKVRYLTVKNIGVGGTVDFSGCDVIDEKARALVHKRSQVAKGDILFASIAPLGRCFIVEEDPADWDINESVFSIRPNYQLISTNFLYMYFMSPYFIKKAELSSTGSIFAGIRMSTFQQMQMLIPPKYVLCSFDKIIDPIYKDKYGLWKQNQTLKDEMNFLLPVLLNGQVKIE